jgi:hypothetical protein
MPAWITPLLRLVVSQALQHHDAAPATRQRGAAGQAHHARPDDQDVDVRAHRFERRRERKPYRRSGEYNSSPAKITR